MRQTLTSQHLGQSQGQSQSQRSKHSGYSSTDTNSDFTKDGSSSSTNPSPHSDQEDSTNLQLLSRCTMSSSSNGNPLKKHHHDHMTTAGQGLTTKDPINLLSSSSSVSQSETDEGTIVGHHVPCYYTWYYDRPHLPSQHIHSQPIPYHCRCHNQRPMKVW